AGMTAWHGVNADCTGEEKDGDNGFGIWNNSIPNYELSQTINGVENGSYVVRAALMVGANNNGSRRTTQRIFANLNSTYFGAEMEYDETELDNSEAYGFAGLIEPTTDTEMQGIEVRAFVYDGTLTFGVRTDGNYKAALRTSTNGAGGDGWFKVDNFTIQKVNYEVEDALNILTHYTNILDNYVSDAVMSDAKRTQAEALQEAYSNIDASNTQEEIVQSILSAKDMIVQVSASVKAYQRLRDAIDEHYNTRDMYDHKKGIQAYSDAIDEADAAYSDALLDSDEEIDALIKSLDDVPQACIQSDDITPGDDLTDYIQNPSFEDYSLQGSDNSSGVEHAPKGWNLYLNGTQVSTAAEISAAGVANWCAINKGDGINVELEDGSIVTQQPSDGEHLWGIWTGTIPAVELSQTIKNMPAGTYTVICDVLVQYNWAGDCITTQRIFANDYVAMYSSEDRYEANLPADALIAADIDRLTPEATIKHLTYAGHQCEAPRSDYSYPVSLTFGLAEQGDITIGFRTNNIGSDGTALESGKGWFKLDNWQLIYENNEVPTGAEVGADATGVDTVEEAATQTTVEFYSINGTRLTAPQKGINIVKMSNGTVVKTYVR
ncbi:MAG: hypothetical protein K2O61_02460, partial [Bacteroidaceae bacterium]|nr:hypothetical protein [Bacteroidaceae bacterium]